MSTILTSTQLIGADDMSYYNSPNRYVCEVLEEMRKQLNVLSIHNLDRYKSSMAMLIEESQTLVNRMESALSDWSDIRRAHWEIKGLKAEIKELESDRDSFKISSEKNLDTGANCSNLKDSKDDK